MGVGIFGCVLTVLGMVGCELAHFVWSLKKKSGR